MANLYDYEGNFIGGGSGGSVEIADNLSTDNASAALSAKQGVILKNIIGATPIPSDLTKRDYNGKSISITDNHKYAFKLLQTMSYPTGVNPMPNQGAACYGDFLFYFQQYDTNKTPYIHIYNLRTKNYIQSLLGGDDFSFGDFTRVHGNTVNFGHDFYDDNDPFPLLYISTGYPTELDGVNTTGAVVYRITTTVNNGVTTYGLVLVQQIMIPNTSWTEFVIGDNRMCYIMTGSTSAKKSRIRSYRLPDAPPNGNATVEMDLSNPLDEYYFNTFFLPDYNSSNTDSKGQCCIYCNGMILSVSGLDKNTSYFFAWDFATCTRTVIKLGVIPDGESSAFNYEPESLFIWNNTLCITTNNHPRIYALYFE